MATTKLHVLLLLISFINGYNCYNDCYNNSMNRLALIAIHEPAVLLQIYDRARDMGECLDMCCSAEQRGATASRRDCNAVSFYESGSRFLCVLLSCQPFDKCVWKATAQNFVAAYVKRNALTTTVATATTAAMTTTTVAMTTTTTVAMTTTTTVATTTTPALIFVLETDPPPQWNIMEDETKKITTTNRTTTTSLHIPLTSTLSLAHSNILTNHKPTPLDQSQRDTQTTSWYVENLYALIGVGCMLCFLTLVLAVVMKKYRDRAQGKPQYRQLRDYDVRVEPPASGASLLAA